jgi:hypothetical protein
MMIDPVDSDDDEAQDVGKKGRPHFREGRRVWIVRRLQLQNHDGNENGENAIAERFDPVRFHASECNTGEFARNSTALDRELRRTGISRSTTEALKLLRGARCPNEFSEARVGAEAVQSRIDAKPDWCG